MESQDSNPAAAPSNPASRSAIAEFLKQLEGAKQLRDGLLAHEARVAKAKQALQEAMAARDAELGKVQEVEAAILVQYPEAATLLGLAPVAVAKRRGRKPGSVAKAPRKVAAAAPVAEGLTLDQAESVIAALGKTFSLAEFRHKTAALFPGARSKGGIEILGDRVRNAGGKGMGMKFKKV